MIDDPLRKSRNNQTREGPQRLRDGDFPFDRNQPQKTPDLRLNGVIFDIKRISSPDAMVNQMKTAIEKGQTQNFVMHTNPEMGSIRDYYRKLERLNPNRSDGAWVRDLKQVILVDQRTGQTLFWHR
nr:hypothetical protein [Agrobacterium rubi]